MSDPLLTPAEHAALDITRMLAASMATIVADNSPFTRADWAEFSTHLHAIQHMIMAQAAARAYPDKYRLLGGADKPVTKHARDPE